jgi:hypothetical protein
MDLWLCRLRAIEEVGDRIEKILRSAECGLRDLRIPKSEL